MQITFDVMSVPKPLLSTSALKRREVTIIFNHDYDRIIFRNETVHLVSHDCHSYLRVTLAPWLAKKHRGWQKEQASNMYFRDCDSKTRTMANCGRHRRHAGPHNRKMLVSVLDGTTVHARILAALQLGARHEGHIPIQIDGNPANGTPTSDWRCHRQDCWCVNRLAPTSRWASMTNGRQNRSCRTNPRMIVCTMRSALSLLFAEEVNEQEENTLCSVVIRDHILTGEMNGRLVIALVFVVKRVTAWCGWCMTSPWLARVEDRLARI